MAEIRRVQMPALRLHDRPMHGSRLTDSIINIVQTGHLTGKYEDIARQLADILKSAEVEQLPTEAKEEVAALAEIVKDELGKAPSPDQGKLRRGVALLGKALGRLGANTEGVAPLRTTHSSRSP
jgi:hypothetical protein